MQTWSENNSGSSRSTSAQVNALTQLNQICDYFDQFENAIPLTTISEKLEGLSLTGSDIADYIKFDPSLYQRTLFRRGSAYEAIVMTWLSGQKTPLHNHRGSSCVVQVIEGTASEILFEKSPSGVMYPLSTSRLERGTITASADKDMHIVSNLEGPQDPLITLHVYSPPLHTMDLFPAKDTVFADYEELMNRVKSRPSLK